MTLNSEIRMDGVNKLHDKNDLGLRGIISNAFALPCLELKTNHHLQMGLDSIFPIWVCYTKGHF